MEFTAIKGYEGYYEISKESIIKSIGYGKEKILKQSNNGGYSEVVLWNNKKGRRFKVHRLVAQAFLGLDIKSNLCVLHKKEDLINGRLNNELNNLWLGTKSDNIKDCINKGRFTNPTKGKFGKDNKRSKKVIQYNKDLVILKKWDSITQISNILGISITCISDCCNGKQNTSLGYIWKFA